MFFKKTPIPESFNLRKLHLPYWYKVHEQHSSKPGRQEKIISRIGTLHHHCQCSIYGQLNHTVQNIAP